MSDHPLPPRNYTIENDWWVGQLVSVGGEDAVVGSCTFGGTQKWKLAYKDSFAIFQGVPPSDAEGKYIAIDWNSMVLVCSKQPSKFILERVDAERRGIFVVKVAIENGSQSSFGWQLQTGKNGSHVRIANVELQGAEWKFSS